MGHCISLQASPYHHRNRGGRRVHHHNSTNASSRAAAAEVEERKFLEQMAQDRREGRALLRRMIVKSDDVDWKDVIMQADSLHQREQERWQQQEQRNRRREKKRALDQRKKADAVGSFSVNLLTMKHSEEDVMSVDLFRRFRKHRSDATHSIASSVVNDDDDDQDGTDCFLDDVAE